MSKRDDPIVLCLTTVGSETDAAALARTLVSEKLAACVSRLPVASVYEWQGKLEEEGEVLLLLKSTDSLRARLEARILELSSYDCPEFLVFGAADSSEAYAAWVRRAVE